MNEVKVERNVSIQESATIKNMKVEDAAKELGKSIQFVRVQLQRGLVNWGNAIIISGNKYTYYISPTLFYKAIGKPLPDKYKEIKELQGENRYRVITESAEMTAVFENWRRKNA